MEKMKMHTPNFTDENIAKIAEMFPYCVTEVENDFTNAPESNNRCESATPAAPLHNAYQCGFCVGIKRNPGIITAQVRERSNPRTVKARYQRLI